MLVHVGSMWDIRVFVSGMPMRRHTESSGMEKDLHIHFHPSIPSRRITAITKPAEVHRLEVWIIH